MPARNRRKRAWFDLEDGVGTCLRNVSRLPPNCTALLSRIIRMEKLITYTFDSLFTRRPRGRSSSPSGVMTIPLSRLRCRLWGPPSFVSDEHRRHLPRG
jgi:hypothetical protein